VMALTFAGKSRKGGEEPNHVGILPETEREWSDRGWHVIYRCLINGLGPITRKTSWEAGKDIQYVDGGLRSRVKPCVRVRPVRKGRLLSCRGKKRGDGVSNHELQ